MIFVIDSSVYIKWFVFEAGHEEALSLFEREPEFLAPTFIVCEVANVAWKKVRRGEIDEEDGDLMIARCIDGSLSLLPEDKLALSAWRIARELDHPVYDCFYLACAEAVGSSVITADDRLLARVRGTPYGRLVRRLGEI